MKRTRDIYLASSWRNAYQPTLVRRLRDDGHSVYDFRNPSEGNAFRWDDIAPHWQQWTAEEYVTALSTAYADRGFKSDFGGMQWCDTCVLLLPAGSSAHLEFGWCAGAGRECFVLALGIREPELMLKVTPTERIFLTTPELRKALLT